MEIRPEGLKEGTLSSRAFLQDEAMLKKGLLHSHVLHINVMSISVNSTCNRK